MFNKNKSVSLSKGQSLGESSLSGNVVKSIMSPCSEQNGVSPDYVPMSGVDNSSDLIKNTAVSSTEKVGEAVAFLSLMI